MTLDDVTRMMIELDIDTIAAAVESLLDSGTGPGEILNALTTGLDEVGRRYETSEYFLAELVLAGETMKDALAVLGPYLKAEKSEAKDTVVVATVKGDNHDIGKNLLVTMLLSSGLRIVDLGMDCPSETIVNKVRETGARVVALSCLLTMTIREISAVDQALREAGLRDGVKLIVGGAPLNMELAKELGADDFGADAIEGARRIQALLEG